MTRPNELLEALLAVDEEGCAIFLRPKVGMVSQWQRLESRQFVTISAGEFRLSGI